MRSAVELGVSLLFGAAASAARFWEGAEPAARVGAEEGVAWLAPWSCVAASSVFVPGAGLESDRSGDGAVVMSSVVWVVAALGSLASGGTDAFGLLPGPGATVDVGAATVGADGDAGAGIGLTALEGAPATPGVVGGVRVGAEEGETLGLTEDAVAGEIPESVRDSAAGEEVVADEVSGLAEGAAADEEVVASEASGLEEYATAGEEVVASEASVPAGDAMAGLDVPASTGEEVG